jgi:hypothetical protein
MCETLGPIATDLNVASHDPSRIPWKDSSLGIMVSADLQSAIIKYGGETKGAVQNGTHGLNSSERRNLPAAT